MHIYGRDQQAFHLTRTRAEMWYSRANTIIVAMQLACFLCAMIRVGMANRASMSNSIFANDALQLNEVYLVSNCTFNVTRSHAFFEDVSYVLSPDNVGYFVSRSVQNFRYLVSLAGVHFVLSTVNRIWFETNTHEIRYHFVVFRKDTVTVWEVLVMVMGIVVLLGSTRENQLLTDYVAACNPGTGADTRVYNGLAPFIELYVSFFISLAVTAINLLVAVFNLSKKNPREEMMRRERKMREEYIKEMRRQQRPDDLPKERESENSSDTSVTIPWWNVRRRRHRTAKREDSALRDALQQRHGTHKRSKHSKHKHSRQGRKKAKASDSDDDYDDTDDHHHHRRPQRRGGAGRPPPSEEPTRSSTGEATSEGGLPKRRRLFGGLARSHRRHSSPDIGPSVSRPQTPDRHDKKAAKKPKRGWGGITGKSKPPKAKKTKSDAALEAAQRYEASHHRADDGDDGEEAEIDVNVAQLDGAGSAAGDARSSRAAAAAAAASVDEGLEPYHDGDDAGGHEEGPGGLGEEEEEGEWYGDDGAGGLGEDEEDEVAYDVREVVDDDAGGDPGGAGALEEEEPYYADDGYGEPEGEDTYDVHGADLSDGNYDAGDGGDFGGATSATDLSPRFRKRPPPPPPPPAYSGSHPSSATGSSRRRLQPPSPHGSYE